MKVGILTFHAAHNYGAMLQTYALKLSCEKMGYQTAVIDYNPEYIRRQYQYFKPQKNIKGNLCNILNLCGNISKQKRFEEFKNTYFDLIPPDSGEKFDALLYGSDQIWNPNISGDFDSFFFGENPIQTKRNIAYAASLGKHSLDDREKERFSVLAPNLDAISLREETAQKVLQPLCSQQTEVTLDPTLLTEEKDWENIAVSAKNTHPYILVYEVALFPETMKTAKELSKRTGLPIVRIMYSRTHLRYEYKTLNGLGPREFLGWIKNAAYVVTSSFHGTAFSLIFEKNFYTIPHSSYASRMTDLLSKLHLNARLVRELPAEITDIDYDNVRPLLNREKEKSLSFLKNSINKTKEE